MKTLTVLDYLNGDCWQAVLQYVPVKNVILSERVSRRWQGVVLEYLRHVRICIDQSTFEDETLPNVSMLQVKNRDLLSFESWTNKLGLSVVEAHCATQDFLKIIRNNCPNMESVTFCPRTIKKKNLNLLLEPALNFKPLKHLNFSLCNVSDCCVYQIVGKTALEELVIRGDDQFTGQFLAHIELKNLRSLFFFGCQGLEKANLLAAANRLSGLTKLKLIGVPTVVLEDIHLLLEKLSKLEHLNLNMCGTRNLDSFCDAVCQLSRLKDLTVNSHITDKQILAISRCCQELRTLKMICCPAVTGRGVRDVCAAAGARLAELSVKRSHNMTDDDIVACARACPDLQFLDISYCDGLSRELRPRLAAARREVRARRTLRLRVRGTPLCDLRFKDKVSTQSSADN